MSQVIALQHMFEGLYGRSLRPTGALKERLRERGYDLDRPRTSYPLAVWADCLDASASELHPKLPRADAWERLGGQFIDGYFETLVGRMIAVTLPFMSAKLFLGRVPRFMTTGLQHAEVELIWTDDRNATLTIRRMHELSGRFMTGVLRGSFARMNLRDVKLVPRALHGVDTAVDVTLP